MPGPENGYHQADRRALKQLIITGQDFTVLTILHYYKMRWIIIMLIIFLSGQSGKMLSQEWIRTYSSTTGVGYIPQFVIESYDKGYVILGHAFNYKYGLILKTDINGNLLWNKLFGNGVYQNMFRNIEQTLDSGYIVSGTISKYGTKDAFIMKLNPCFEREWCKVLHTTNQYDDYGRKIKPLPDEGYLLLTAYYEGLDQGSRIHLHRFSSIGELIWQESYPAIDSLMFGEEANDLNIIGDSNYLITGHCFYPNPGQSGGWVRPLLISVDSSGSMEWETIWGVSDFFYGKTYNSTTDLNSNLYSIGFHIGYDAQYPAMVKTGPQGQELLYSDLVDTAYFGQGQTITFMEDSNLFIALGWKDQDETTLHNGFMKADTHGIPLGFHEVPLLSHALISTAKTFDNKYITVGIHKDNSLNRWVIYAFKLNSDLEYDTLYNTSFVYDSLCPYAIPSDTTDMDCDILVMIDDKFIPLDNVKLNVFPNPAADIITVSYPDVTHTGQREIVLFNSLGMEVKKVRLMKGDEETRLDISELPPGIYFVIMTDNGRRIGQEKAVKR
jgi:hypothetical protein